MANRYKIFLRSARDDVDVRAEVERVLGGDLAATDEEGRWLHTSPTTWVVLRDRHGLEDDVNLPFESHSWSVTLRDRENFRDRELEEAERIYEALRSTGHFSLFLVDGVTSPVRSDIVG